METAIDKFLSDMSGFLDILVTGIRDVRDDARKLTDVLGDTPVAQNLTDAAAALEEQWRVLGARVQRLAERAPVNVWVWNYTAASLETACYYFDCRTFSKIESLVAHLHKTHPGRPVLFTWADHATELMIRRKVGIT